MFCMYVKAFFFLFYFRNLVCVNFEKGDKFTMSMLRIHFYHAYFLSKLWYVMCYGSFHSVCMSVCRTFVISSSSPHAEHVCMSVCHTYLSQHYQTVSTIVSFGTSDTALNFRWSGRRVTKIVWFFTDIWRSWVVTSHWHFYWYCQHCILLHTTRWNLKQSHILSLGVMILGRPTLVVGGLRFYCNSSIYLSTFFFR